MVLLTGTEITVVIYVQVNNASLVCLCSAVTVILTNFWHVYIIHKQSVELPKYLSFCLVVFKINI